MLSTRPLSLFLLTVLLMLNGCDKSTPVEPVNLIFSVEDDKELGLQLRDEIESNPEDYPVLDREENSEAYAYIEGLRDEILDSDDIIYKDEFDWEIRIIDEDVLNAFAAPGGYIYVYTGIIKYLEEEDDLMGVLGHEIAHADKRHSVKQLAQVYGVELLLSMALGNSPSGVTQTLGMIAGKGAALKFSRDDEAQADEFSVKYLADSPYRCDGAATFFERLSASGNGGSTPEFLSTHPSPDNRVEDIRQHAEDLGCSTEALAPESYADFKALLP